MPKLFKVYDRMRLMTVARCDTLKEARKAADDFEKETDGDCYFSIYRYEPSAKEYYPV